MEKRPNQGKQTEFVKRALINWISDHNLKIGERIPTQAELRERLGVGNAVIGRAIQTLVDDGLLANHHRKGITVLNPHVDGYEGRTIGLICHRDVEFSTMACLMQAFCIVLSRHACHISLFIKNKSEHKDEFDLREFHGLAQASQKHRIDGVVSTVLLNERSVRQFEKHKIPLCYMGVSNPNAPGVMTTIRLEKFLENVKKHGFQRPMLVMMGHPDTARRREEFLAASRNFDFAPLQPQDYCHFIREDGRAAWDSQTNWQVAVKLAKDIAAMPRELKPDCLVIPDDVLACWMYPVFLQSGWQPELFHWQNEQMPFSKFLGQYGPFLHYDAMKMAELTMEQILNLLQENNYGRNFVEYEPPLCEKNGPGNRPI